jgi:hypothetical protein
MEKGKIIVSNYIGAKFSKEAIDLYLFLKGLIDTDNKEIWYIQ